MTDDRSPFDKCLIHKRQNIVGLNAIFFANAQHVLTSKMWFGSWLKAHIYYFNSWQGFCAIPNKSVYKIQ